MSKELLQPCVKCAPIGDRPLCVRCDRCPSPASWSIQNLEGVEMLPTVRWFACGRHVHRVLSEGRWDMDAVQIQHIEHPGQWVTS